MNTRALLTGFSTEGLCETITKSSDFFQCQFQSGHYVTNANIALSSLCCFNQ